MVTGDGTGRPALAPHQKAAAVRLDSILRCHRGAVLADEPGLGKTWVAAEVAAGRSASRERIDVVVPASLRGYWRDVLSAFGVVAEVTSHEALARGETTGDRCGARLVIVDEAHRFRNPLTKRYEGLARSSVNARLLLVTATPVCNSPHDLLALLNLIVADDELAAHGVSSIAGCFAVGGSEMRSVMRELVVRQTMRDAGIVSTTRSDFIIEYDPMETMPGLGARFRELTFPWVADSVHSDLLVGFLERRLESSVAALSATLRRMKRVCRRAQHLAARGAWLSATDLRGVLGDPDASRFQDIMFPELWGARMAPGECGREVFERESERLTAIENELGHDRKIELLRSIVADRSAIPGLVFTVSFDTAFSLFEELSSSVRCALLTGRHCVAAGARRSMDAVVRALQNGEVDLLVATDLGGEGLNLQKAGYVVHYDQPWNPAILEQRNGRICRIGQRRDRVEAFQLLAIGSRSGCTVLVKKKVNDHFWAVASGGAAPSGGTERQKWRLPSRVESGCPQVRLVRRLRGRDLSTAEIAGMLSGRHRVGVERLLECAAREILDAAAVERVVEVLRRERAMIADFGSTI